VSAKCDIGVTATPEGFAVSAKLNEFEIVLITAINDTLSIYSQTNRSFDIVNIAAHIVVDYRMKNPSPLSLIKRN
jgi:hypothetical protein